MTVTVGFDDRVWGRLASMADVQGTTIPELLESAVERLLVGTTRARRETKESRAQELARTRDAHKAALVAEMIRLRKAGHTLQQISEVTGYAKTYVSRLLCENGHRTWTRSDARTGHEELKEAS